MATQIGVVEGILRLKNTLSAEMSRAASDMEKHGQRMEQAGRRMSAVGGEMTKAITLPLAAVGGGAVKAFSDFDSAMTKSTAIMGDVSEAMREDMASSAREMARETIFSARQAADSYFFLASAGLDAESSIAALPRVAEFAQAGMFDMATATDLLTDAQSALGLTIREDAVANMENMVRVSDVLVKANTLANATVEQFSTSLTREAGAALKSFNISVEEGVSVLAAFADQGVKGEIAGTGLSRILRLMTSAAVNNAKAYEEMNVEVFDANKNIRNLAEIIADLENALGGLADEDRVQALEELGFMARVQGVILPLVGASDSIREYQEALEEAGGITREVAEKQLQSFANRMRLLKDRIVDVAITLGGSLAPVLQDFAENTLGPLVSKLGELAQGFAELPKPVRAAAVAVASLTAAAGPALLIAGGLTSAWGALAGSLPALGAALARVLAFFAGPAGWVAAGVATIAAWRPAREFFLDLGRKVFRVLAEWVGVAIQVIRRLWGVTRPGRQVFAELIGFVGQLAGAFSGLAGVVSDQLRESLSEIFEDTGIVSWREFLSNALEASVQAVGRAARAFRRLWESTEEGRRFLLEFARVAADDVAEALAAVVRFTVDYVMHTARAVKETALWVAGFLAWMGVVEVVQAAVKVFVAGVKLMIEWMEEAVERLAEWIGESDNFLKIVAFFNPALAGLISKAREWAKEAKKNLSDPNREASETAGDAADAATEFEKALAEMEGALSEGGDATKELSGALAEAVNSIESEIKVNQALAGALSESQEAYEALNVLLEAGIPLAEALSGEYDDLASQLIESREAVDDIQESLRGLAAATAAGGPFGSLFDLARDMLRASEIFDQVQPLGGGSPFGIGPIPGVFLEDIQAAMRLFGQASGSVLETVGEIRREEQERKKILEDINDLLERGEISQEEAAEAAKRHNIDTGDQVRVNWQEVWSDVASTAISEMAGALSAILDDTKSTSQAMSDIVVAAFTAAGASIAGAWGAALGGLFGGIFSDALGLGSDRDKVAGVVGLGSEETFGNTLTAARNMNDAMLEIMNEVERLGRLFGFTATGLQDIRVVIQESGRAAVEINGSVRAVFDNVQDAQQFAAQLAVAFADVAGGVGEFVDMLQRAANQAENAEEFNRAVDALRRVMEVELGETGTAVFDAIQNFHDLADALQDVGLSSARAGDVLSRDLKAIRDDITGVGLSARQLFEMRRMEFNREIEREKQRQQAALASAEADVAAAEAELARITSSTAFTEAQLTAFEIEQTITDQMTQEMRQRLNAARELLFGARQAAETARTALENLPDPISADEFRAPETGPTDAERLADAMKKIERSLLPSLARQMAELRIKYEELIQLAGDDAEALSRLMALRRQEAELIRQQATEDLFGGIKDFEQAGPADDARSPLRGIREEADKLREQAEEWAATMAESAEESGKFFDEAKRLGDAYDRINAAEKRRIDLLAKNVKVDLFGSLADLVQDEDLRHRLLMQMERIRFTLEMEQLRAQFILLQELGKLTQAQIQMVNEAFKFIDANTDKILQARMPVIRSAGGGGSRSGSSGRDEAAAARNRLREIMARSLSPFEQAIRRTVDEFAELRKTLGWTAEVQAAYAREIRRVLKDQLGSIERLQEELAFRTGSSMRPIDQFRLAQRQLVEAQERLAGGDLSALDEIPELARRVLELNPAAQASEGNRFIEKWVNDILSAAQEAAEEAALGIEPGGANDPFAWLRAEPTEGDRQIQRTIRVASQRVHAVNEDVAKSNEEIKEEQEKTRATMGERLARQNRLAEETNRQIGRTNGRLGIHENLLRSINKRIGQLPDRITQAGVS